MGRSSKERVARWRERMKADPVRYAQYKQKEHERYLKKKERGIVKSIADMTPREQNKTRRAWRISQRTRTKRLKHMKDMMTPPTSPDDPRTPENRRQQVAQNISRKKKLRDRAKAYRKIIELTTALKNETRLKERYKKRNQRLMKANGKRSKSSLINEKEKETEKHASLSRLMIDHIRKRYKETKSYKQRQLISTLICSHAVLKKYRLRKYASKVFGMTMKRLKGMPNNSFVGITSQKRDVIAYFERDDNSRIKADKKATITKFGCKKQIRLLNDDIKNIHEKYRSETGKKISYSLFCRFKPFWVIKPTSADRQTCLCKIHDNLNMKIITAFSANMYKSKNMNDLLKNMTCDNSLDNKECMYRDCAKCKFKIIPVTDTINMGRQVVWKIWRNKRFEIPTQNGDIKNITKTVKENEQGTIQQLHDEIQVEANRSLRHIYNIRHQYRAISKLKDSLNDDDLVIHIDFSENYQCKYHQEIQSIHFGASQQQISLHTGVAYTKDQIYTFTSFSDCLKHNPAGIWAHLEPVMTWLKQKSNTKVVHVLSDGPTTQYRNRQNMYLFSTKLFDLGFTNGSWNYFEASHGKGAADGIGATIKQQADRAVNVRGNDITCAREMIDVIRGSGTSVELFEIKEDDVEKIEQEIPKKLKSVPDTMKIHQVC